MQIFNAVSRGEFNSFCKACCVSALDTHKTMVVPKIASGLTPSNQPLSRAVKRALCCKTVSVLDHTKAACDVGSPNVSAISPPNLHLAHVIMLILFTRARV